MKPYVQCAKCALRDRPIVRPRLLKGGKLLIVGEFPSIDDAKRGEASITGRELDTGLGMKGPASKYSFTTAVLCTPEGNDLEKARRRAKKDKTKKVRDPVECCNEGLQKIVKRFPHVVVLGSVAVEACLRERATIGNLRGFPVVRRGRTYFPTLAPFFVTRNTRWRHVFRNDLAKAFRTFEGRLHWKDPRRIEASVHNLQVMHKKARALGRLFLDVETDGIEPLLCRLRCVGIGIDRDHIIVVPFRAIDGREIKTVALHRALFDILSDEHIILIGHNAGSFDRLVLENHQWPEKRTK